MYFCSACFAKECNSSDRTRCYRCRVLSKHPLDRNALMKLRVRDLVWFLAKKHVSVEYCKVCNLKVGNTLVKKVNFFL